MAKPVSHQLDIYGAWLHVATDRRAWATLRRKVPGLETPEAGCIGWTCRVLAADGAIHLGLYFDMTRLADNPKGLTEILGHEATHAGTMLLDHIGQAYDGESEALAYLVGFIAAFAWEACAA